MLNREIQLLLTDKPVSPLLLKVDYMRWEGSSGQIDSLSKGMSSNEGIHGSVQDVHFLEEISSLFKHTGGNQLGRDFFELVLRNSNVVGSDNVSCLGWKTSLKIETNRCVVVSFSLLDFSSLGLLICLEQPLEVVLLEFSDIRMVFLFGYLDRLVPSVKLLVHGHGFLDLIMLNENGLSLMELLVQDSKLCLDSEVVNSFLSDELVDLSEVVSLGDVSKSSIASLSYVEVLLLDCHLSYSLPVGLSLWGELEWLEDLNSSGQSIVLKSSSKLDQCLIKIISYCVGSIIDKDFSLPFISLNGFNISLNLVHGHLVSLINAVPDAEIVPVLGNNNVTVWHPADELAVVEQSLLLLFLDVVQVKLSSLVTEQKLVASWIQLKIVDLTVVSHGGLNLVESQILYADSQGVEEIGDDLSCLLTTLLLLL